MSKFTVGSLKCGAIADIDNVEKRQDSKQDNRIPETFLLAWGYNINTKILERETWEMCRMRPLPDFVQVC